MKILFLNLWVTRTDWETNYDTMVKNLKQAFSNEEKLLAENQKLKAGNATLRERIDELQSRKPAEKTKSKRGSNQCKKTGRFVSTKG